MKKLLYVTPHLSTGGLPQYLLKKIKLLLNDYDIYCVEYANISDAYVIQKNAIKSILGKKFYTLGDRKEELLEIVKLIQPDIIHLEETPEHFMAVGVATTLYKKERNYVIVETTHSSDFDITKKVFLPDKFMGVCQFTTMQYINLDIPMSIVESSVDKVVVDKKEARKKVKFWESHKHIVTVGLFTPRKNQSYVFEIAKKLLNKRVHFHFIGNQADNFKSYWEPLLKNKPANCFIHGEKSNVNEYLQACDLSLFASQGRQGDMELNPLVIKETLEANTKLMMYNLDVYLKKYDNHPDVFFLTGNADEDSRKITEILQLEDTTQIIETQSSIYDSNIRLDTSFDAKENKIHMTYHGPTQQYQVSVKDLASGVPIYCFGCQLSEGTYYWIVPIRYNPFQSFFDKPNFTGFLLEFYSADKTTLIKAFEMKLKEASVESPKIPVAPFDCAYSNYEEFFILKIYDEFIDSLGHLKTTVDVGANIGVFVNYLLHKGADKVYAVEPEKVAIQSLKYSVAESKKVTVIPAALGNNNETRKLFTTTGNTTISSFFEEQKTYNPSDGWYEESVDVITFDTLLKNNNIDSIDLMKIDIEGAEYELFDSMTDEDFGKINNMLIEYHMNRDGRLAPKILDRLDKLGFEYVIHKQSTTEVSTREEAVARDNGIIFVRRTKKRAFVTHCDATYLPLVDYLVKSVLEFTTLPVIVYTVDCDYIPINNPRVITKRIDLGLTPPRRYPQTTFVSQFGMGEFKTPEDSIIGIDPADINAHYIMRLKPEVILDALNNGIDEGIYLDSDILLKENASDLLKYFGQVDGYPLVAEGVHDFIIKNGKYPIEIPLMKHMGVAQRSMHYVNTGMIVFNQSTRKFMEDWRDLCKDPVVLANYEEMLPYQDETALNVVLWKLDATKKLPLIHYNVRNIDSANLFYNTNKSNTFLESEWQKIPTDKNDVKCFHGCKSPSELEKIFNLVKEKFQRR